MPNLNNCILAVSWLLRLPAAPTQVRGRFRRAQGIPAAKTHERPLRTILIDAVIVILGDLRVSSDGCLPPVAVGGEDCQRSAWMRGHGDTSAPLIPRVHSVQVGVSGRQAACVSIFKL